MAFNFWLNYLAKVYFKTRQSKLDYLKKNPIQSQTMVWQRLIQKAKDTAFGKHHGFKNIQSKADFIKQVPLHYYDDLRPWIEKAQNGEKDVLWPGITPWFAKSSGTTDKSKFIPITKDSLYGNHYKSGGDMFSNYIKNHPDTKIFGLQNLRLGGSQQLLKSGTGWYGDLSAIMISQLPLWAEWMNKPNKEISLMNQWDDKLKAIVEDLSQQNVGSFTGVPSWMLITLQRIKQANKVDYLDDLWPNVELFFHGGVGFGPYQNSYDRLFRKKIRFYEIYNASEGFFAFQDQPHAKDLLLMVNHGVYFEFIPLDELDKPQPNTLDLSQANTNTTYALVISTTGGLWRYIIGDTVRFTSLNPYRIKIIGRTKHFINVFGEELMINNTEEALSKICIQHQCAVKDYTVAPIFMDDKNNGAHEWLIEFEIPPMDAMRFASDLDATLQSLNSDYEAKRYNNITLRSLELHVAPKGLFYKWLETNDKLGGQNKIPRLSNSREYIESLNQLMP